MLFTPGTKVRVVFDRITMFNGRMGKVVATPAGTAGVLVEMLEGSEVGRNIFFAPEELLTVRPLMITDLLHIEPLIEAVDVLRSRENIAALKEGLGEICSPMVAVCMYLSHGQIHALFDYGQIGDRSSKAARILYLDDSHYELEWT